MLKTQTKTLDDPPWLTKGPPDDPLTEHPTATMASKKVPWSSRVVGAAGRRDVAVESHHGGEFAAGNFTDRLTDMLDEAPELSIDEAIDAIAKQDVSTNGDNPQYPTASRAGAGQTQQARRKFSLIIANSDYNQEEVKKNGTFEDLKDLKARGDAFAMASSLASRDFQLTRFGVHFDLTASQMRARMYAAAAEGGLGEGDLLVIHYAGHGDRSGLVGVNGRILPNGFISGLSTIAQKLGFQLRVTLDSCYSGSAVATDVSNRAVMEKIATSDPARTEQFERLKELRDYASGGLHIDCQQAVRDYYSRMAEAAGLGSLVTPHLEPTGEHVDKNKPRVNAIMTKDEAALSEWWREEGWLKLSWMIEPYDTAHSKTYQIPNHDHPVTYDKLQDIVDDVLAEILFDMGVDSQSFVDSLN